MKMTIPYNITGKLRKQLAEDISVALHTIPKYLGYPTERKFSSSTFFWPKRLARNIIITDKRLNKNICRARIRVLSELSQFCIGFLFFKRPSGRKK